jgi:hypothetical protein
MMVEVKDNISSQTKDAKTRNKSDPDPDQGFSDYRITWGSSSQLSFPTIPCCSGQLASQGKCLNHHHHHLEIDPCHTEHLHISPSCLADQQLTSARPSTTSLRSRMPKSVYAVRQERLYGGTEASL